MKNDTVLLELVKQYDKVRQEYIEATKAKDEVSALIKERLGAATEGHCEGYRVTYQYDKDKSTETFDQAKFAKKEPANYKLYLVWQEKYTLTKTVQGARRLVITRELENED